MCQVAETLPVEVLGKMHAPPKPVDVPIIDPHIINQVRARRARLLCGPQRPDPASANSRATAGASLLSALISGRSRALVVIGEEPTAGGGARTVTVGLLLSCPPCRPTPSCLGSPRGLASCARR
jgi:hypothetical protein